MKKVNLSFVDRASAVDLLPKTGNLEKVKKTREWIKELEMTPEEKEVEQSFNQIRDKDEKSKALNDWYHTSKEMEISDELYSYIKDELSIKDESSSITITENLGIYDAFLGDEQ